LDRLADPAISGVVLAGGMAYASLPALPAVANNLATLREVLADPALWGLPDANCVTVLDPPTPLALDAAVRRMSATVGPDGLALFYFAGHGLIDPRTGGLHLAVHGTDPHAVYATATPYEWVRRAFVDAPASRRVVILDCCYSGRAIAGMGAAAVADEVEIDRTCVLVAASGNRSALAPPDEPYTSFTGAVIDLLRAGLPGGPELLDLTTVYERVHAVQRSRGRPLPELRARNGGERIPLVRNRAAVPAGARDEPTPVRGAAIAAGQVLLGTARLADPELVGAPLAVLAHDPMVGALGVRLGPRLNRLASEVLGPQLIGALPDAVVHDGGPVRDMVILVVELIADAPPVPGFRALDGTVGTLALTADPDLVARAVHRAWVFLGYAGWRPGQLETELAHGILGSSDRSLRDWLTHRPERGPM
jgi:putative AlgH/UPF0301 family transcriptional regulator